MKVEYRGDQWSGSYIVTDDNGKAVDIAELTRDELTEALCSALDAATSEHHDAIAEALGEDL